MSPEQVQSILADFANRGTRIGTRFDDAEVWQFSVDGKHYELHYWEEDNTAIRKYLGGAKAGREFAQLQALQKLTIPATRVIANLKGFRIGQRKGDACITVRDTRAVPLDRLLATRLLDRPERLRLTALLITQLEALHRAKMCPIPLSLNRFALRGEQLILHNGAGVMSGIVTTDRLRELDRSARFVTTASERLRFWKHFTDQAPPRLSRSDANPFLRDVRRGEGTFGPIAIDDWIGHFVRMVPTALPWSSLASTLIEESDWQQVLPELLNPRTATDIKNDGSGSVRELSIVLAGQSMQIIAKRPAFKSGLRGTVQRFRTSRAMRTWRKTWRMLGLGFRCEVPLLVLERRSGLRVLDQLIVFEKVPGETLAKIELDRLPPAARYDLLSSCGQLLRRIESLRFTHADAKHTNWLAWTDRDGRVKPVLIDLDGIRFYPWRGLGIERFVRAMKTHPQITEDDVRALDAGYRGLVPSPSGKGSG